MNSTMLVIFFCFSSNLFTQTINIYGKKTQNKEEIISIDRNLHESLNIYPEIDMYTQGDQGIAQPSLNGLGANSITTILDGIKLNDFSDINNSSQLQFINNSALESLTYSKNHLSSSSFGNSLELALKDETSLNLLYGSNNTNESSLNFSSNDWFDFNFHVSRHYSDGISQADVKNPESDSFENINFFTKASKTIDSLTPYIKFYLIDGKQELDSYDFMTQRPIDSNQSTQYQNLISSLGLKFQKKKSRSLDLSYTINSLERSADNFESESRSKNLNLDLKFNIHPFFNIKSNLQYIQNKIKVSNITYNENIFGFSFLNTLNLKDFLISPFIKIQESNITQIPFGLSVHHNFSKEVSSTLVLAKETNQASLYQKQGGFIDITGNLITVGNPNIKGEKLSKIDWEFSYQKEHSKLAITPFYYWLEDKIFFNSTTFKYLNQEKSKHFGANLSLSSYLFYSYFNLNYRFLKIANNNPLFIKNSPEHKLHLNIKQKVNKFIFNTQLEFKDSIQSFSGNILGSYLLMHFNTTFKISKHLHLDINLHNIFDKKYQDVEFYNTKGFSTYASISFYP